MHQTIQEISLIKDYKEAFKAFDNLPGYAKEKRLLKCLIASSVLGIYESALLDNPSPRNAIEVSRKYANDKATREELKAAAAEAEAATTAVKAVSSAAADAAWVAWAAAWADDADDITTTTRVAVTAARAEASAAYAWQKFHAYLRETLKKMKSDMSTFNVITYVIDDNGNKWALPKNYTEEDLANAKAKLASNINCRNCTNCYDCTNCIDCKDCHDCTNCSRCTDCQNCKDCLDCNNCTDCSRCMDYVDCDCVDCAEE